MKNTIIILAALVVGLVFSSNQVNANNLSGESKTEFGNYTLTPSQSVVMNNVAYKTWQLHYDGTDKTFTVFYAPGAESQCCFTVRNDSFEIQYAKRMDNFGVRLVDAEKRTIRKKDVMRQINYDKFVTQQVLTSNPKTEEEYLGLIACFMPLLFS